jgi:hypothetical protein
VSGADLDRISELASRASLDISPRGVTPRLDGDLLALLDGLGDGDVDALAGRLDGAETPVLAIVWGGALARIGSPAAAARLDAYAGRLTRADPWPGAFPGRREVLLYLGHGGDGT